MAPKSRSKQTIFRETLSQLAKAFLAEPNSKLYNNEDIQVVVSAHKVFLVAVAPHTKRLNPVSLILVAKELVKLNNREAKMFGDSLAQGFFPLHECR